MKILIYKFVLYSIFKNIQVKYINLIDEIEINFLIIE